MAIPVSNKIAPPTFEIVIICFFMFLEKNKNLLIKIPEMINGIAKPKE